MTYDAARNSKDSYDLAVDTIRLGKLESGEVQPSYPGEADELRRRVKLDTHVDYRTVPVYERDENDFYVEPGWCWDLLLEQETFTGSIWDPCCGIGTSIEAFKRKGYDANVVLTGTDLVDRGYRDHAGTHDFLQCDFAAANIVMNPPYRQMPGTRISMAEFFVRHALKLARNEVVAIVQEKFLYSQGRYRLFTGTPIRAVYHYSTRPSMPPGHALAAGDVEAEDGKVNYAALIWTHGFKGDPTTHWLIRKEGE